MPNFAQSYHYVILHSETPLPRDSMPPPAEAPNSTFEFLLLRWRVPIEMR